jgi:SSS family solute:Na+ symporter
VIIGGFYWKRATTAGAWAGMLTGSLLSVTGVLLINVVWPSFLPGWKEAYPTVAWLQSLPESFWLNGMECAFYASLAAVLAYIVVSLLTRPDPNFSFDRLLHRGEFAIEGEHETKAQTAPGLWRLLGVDSEYTRSDKLVVLSIFAWTLLWFVIFVVGTVYGLNNKTTDDGWVLYWYFHVGAYVLVGVITVVWFLWGGFKDLAALFRALNDARRDTEDTGFVADRPKNTITED